MCLLTDDEGMKNYYAYFRFSPKAYTTLVLCFLASFSSAQCGDGTAGTACTAFGGTLISTIATVPSVTVNTWQTLTTTTLTKPYWDFTGVQAGTIIRFASCTGRDSEFAVKGPAGFTAIYRDNDNEVNVGLGCTPNANDESFYLLCTVTGNYSIGINQDGCNNFTSPTTANLYWNVVNRPCAVTNTYGTDVWNGYVWDGVNPNYLYGAIGTQPWNDINVNWGAGQPISTGSCGIMCDADNYATTWYMNKTYDRAWYVFSTPGNDDGRVLSNNGQASWNLINDWGSSAGTSTTGSIAMEGNYNMVFFHRENTGSAAARLTTCQMAGNNTFGSGLWNAYVFDDQGIEDLKYQGTFTENGMNFCHAWGAGQPTMVGERCGRTMDNDYFSVRYIRQEAFPAGNYVIRTITDDGVRVNVAATTAAPTWNVSNIWDNTTHDVTSADIAMDGTMRYIYFDMRENTGSATASFNILKRPVNLTGITSNLANNAICTSGGSITLTAQGTEGTVYWYTGSCGGTYVGTGNSITVSPTGNTTYYARNRNYSDAGCGNVLELFSAVCASINVKVGTPPTGVNAGSDVSISCSNATVLNGTATVPAAPPATIATQNFESGIGSWTTQNNSTGGTPANVAWTIRSGTYTAASDANSGSSFIVSNSDAGGSANTGNTVLQSPVFSTVGYSAMSMTFRHYFRYNSGETANVEISTNGGGAWTTVQSYTSSQGVYNNFASVTLNLNAYVSYPSVYVRFKYDLSYDWYWSIDDISITGTPIVSTVTYAWSPAGGLSATNIANPTATPTSTTTYTLTATSASGCSATDDVIVTVAPSEAPQALGNITVGPAFGGVLPNLNMQASSSFSNTTGPPVFNGSHEPYRGRVFNIDAVGAQAWASQSNTLDLSQYLQIDLGVLRTVDGVATQGREGCCDQWVTSYEVRVSTDNVTYMSVGNFTGNSDRSTVVTNLFPAREWARYVRIYPTGINNHMSMRAEVISIPCGASATVYASAALPPNATTISWYSASSGGTLLGTGQSIARTISANTTIYAQADYASCAASARTPVLLKINAPAGNPAVFGNNAWNVYGYFNPDKSLVSTVYAGNYTQNLISPNTSDMAANGWDPVASPSASAGWSGCPMSKDSYTFTQKRKGFPCGTYAVNMSTWDDGSSLYIDGVQQWNCAAYAGGGCSGTIGTFMLDGNSEVEIRTEEFYGSAIAVGSIVPVTTNTLSASGTTSRTCAVSGSALINFVDINGRLIGSINPNGNNLGNVTMTSYVEAAPLTVNACGTANPVYATSVMGRHWLINPQTQPASAVTVRLPFDNGEFTAVQSAAAANVNPLDNLASIGSVKMSKYSGPANMDGNPANNCVAAGGSGGTTIHSQSANGNITAYIAGFSATGRYIDFSIPGFSEFWMHGGSASPLPVDLTKFTVHCGKQVELNWSTASEANSMKFIVERSRAMDQWNVVGELAAAGNSNYHIDYNLEDPNPLSGISYYRLIQVDNDGAQKTYGPISTVCGEGYNAMTVFPNPTKGEFQVEILSTENISKAELRVADLTGKIISTRTLNIVEGNNQVLFDGNDLKMGTYIIQLVSEGNEFKPVKVVVN